MSRYVVIDTENTKPLSEAYMGQMRGDLPGLGVHNAVLDLAKRPSEYAVVPLKDLPSGDYLRDYSQGQVLDTIIFTTLLALADAIDVADLVPLEPTDPAVRVVDKDGDVWARIEERPGSAFWTDGEVAADWEDLAGTYGPVRIVGGDES